MQQDGLLSKLNDTPILKNSTRTLSFSMTIMTISLLVTACAVLASSSTITQVMVYAQLQDNDDKVAVLETELGTIVIEFFDDDAPNHVSNFINLSESGFYDGVLFHRIISDFMIQGGDPNTINGEQNTWGIGGPGHAIDAEFNDIKHNRGIVSAARSQDPNSAGSQFFIVHQNSNFLDGQYTVFGRIITDGSFETLDAIASVQTEAQDRPVDIEQVRINSIRIIERSEITDALTLSPPERSTESIQTPPPPTEQAYISDELGISFMVPPGWFIQEPGRQNPEAPNVVAIGPQNPADGSMPQFYVYVVDANNMTIEELVDKRVAEIQSIVSVEDFDTLIQEPTVVSGLDAHKFEIIENIAFDNTTIPVKLVEILVYGDEYYYRLAYAHVQTHFETAVPDFLKLLETFEVTGPPTIDSDSPSMDSDDSPSMDTSETMLNDDDSPSMDTSETMLNDDDDGNGNDVMTGDTTTDTQLENELTGAMSSDTGGDNGGCLIATAAFGSELAPQVQSLREIRDNTVLSTQSGVAFMSGFNTVYYSFSPHVADAQREYPIFREAVKLFITPMISSLAIMNAADTNSEGDVVVFGSAIIVLNIGLYIVAPLVGFFTYKKITNKRALYSIK